MASDKNATRIVLGLFLAALSAALLTLSFPPYGVWPLAWVGFVPMIMAQYRILPESMSSLASSVGIGGFFWGYFGAAFEGAVWYMRWLPALIAIAVCFASSRDRRFHERTNYRFFLLQPAVVWVGIEFIRGSIPSVGTWGFLAYSQYTALPVVQWASIVGVYGVSLFIVMANYGLGRAVLLVLDRHPVYTAGSEPRGKCASSPVLDRHPVCTASSGPSCERAPILVLDRDSVCTASRGERAPFLVLDSPRQLHKAGQFALFSILAVALLFLLGSQFLGTGQETVRVAAVQPCFSLRSDFDAGFANLKGLTRSAASEGARVIVWPEGILPVNLIGDSVETELSALARETEAYIVAGYAVKTAQGLINEAVLIGPDGQWIGSYGKDHPVAYSGETSLSRGTYPTFGTPWGDLGLMICYDGDFTDTARTLARNGAILLAVPSSDWPAIADKHYTHLVFRAVETRAAVVKADFGFDSAIIDPYGRLLSAWWSRTGETQILVADVGLAKSPPPATYLGDWVGIVSLLGMAVFIVLDLSGKAN
jgi:apolipoprotein N-acyltransferase